MKKGEKTMKNMKYSITFGIALFCVMLFTACEEPINLSKTNITDTHGIEQPVENDFEAIEDGYGKISINFSGEEAARTVLPSTVFDKYVYIFTKAGEGSGVVKTPDDNGFFTLEVGNYTVAVQAYIGTAEPYTLAANGVSSQFSVGSGINTPVEVRLSGVVAATEGKFSYTITYPADVTAVITLQKWPELSNITLNPVNVSQGNEKTQTLELGAGSYLLTVLVSKDELYAGINEAVHIYPLLSTVYTKEFVDNDLLALIPPAVNDYNISGTGTLIYDGNAKTVSVTPKANVSPGAVTVFYNKNRTVTIDMYDSYGDGWNGSGALRININGVDIVSNVKVQTTAANNTPNNQRYVNTYTFDVTTSDIVQLYWVAGSNQTENSFVVYYADTPPSPVFSSNNQGPTSWSGSNGLIYRIRGNSPSGLNNVTGGTLLGSFTADVPESNGRTTAAPVNLGTYTVTFDVAAATGFNSATGLPAGTLIIDNPTPVASDFTISGMGTFTYNGNERTAIITPKANKSEGAVTILYNGAAVAPLNAGTYPVTFNVAAAPGWKAVSGLSAGTITINKATGATVSASTGASSITSSSFIINAVTAPSNGQTVEYAINTSTTAPTTGYQDGTTFSGLSASTSYYIFARAKENTNYNAGTAARSSSAITTLHTYTVSANGSSTSKTTTLTFTFSGNPGTISTSNISLSGNASIGSAAVSGSGNTRTLSPITLTGTDVTGSVTVSISLSGVETGSKTVTVYNPITAGLYAKAPPISGNDSPVNLSSTSGNNIVDQAFNYINANSGTYTLMLNSDISVAGHSTAEITNVSATRHLKVTNAKLTIIGMNAERKISVTQGSGYGMFAVGRSGYTGIELTIGNNITLVGTTSYVSDHAVQVQNGAKFTMKDNASMSGNYNNRAVSLSSSIFIMQDNAKVTSYGVSCSGSTTITMSGSASIAGGVSVGSGGTITMSDNASVSGGVSGSGSTFTMSGSASVTGSVNIGSDSTFTMKDNAWVSNSSSNGVEVGSNSKFTMQNYAKVTDIRNSGVYVSGSGSEFTMKDNASVSNNYRGVNISSNGTFTMQDNAIVSNNSTSSNGGGVYVVPGYNSIATFTMKDNASVTGNTGGNGGGVYIEGYSSSYKASFIMQGNASVSGNTATANSTTSGGGGVYAGSYSTFEMKGGLVWGNKATGASSNGGGVFVYNNGTFTMSGGTIYGTSESSTTLRNTTGGSGAALYVNSSGSAKFTSNNTDITTPGTGRDSTITVGSTATVNVTVSYNINGGSGTTPASQTVSAGSSITLNSGSGLTRTGYTFGGWNTNPSGTGTNYNASSSYTPLGNITLYAKWDIVLTVNTWKDGNIPSTSGEQWFRFTATAATQYIHVSFGTLTDLYVQVYDSANNPVGSQTNLYSNTKYISRTLTSGQVYYIKVWPYGSSNSGTYKITFNTSSTPPAL